MPSFVQVEWGEKSTPYFQSQKNYLNRVVLYIFRLKMVPADGIAEDVAQDSFISAPTKKRNFLESSMMNGMIPWRRHSFKATKRPTLPFPFWNGWMYSKSACSAITSFTVTQIVKMYENCARESKAFEAAQQLTAIQRRIAPPAEKPAPIVLCEQSGRVLSLS